jgi:hypothetical protein
MLSKFKTEDSLSEIFEAAFNEKMEIIESEWVKYLEAAEQRK